MKRFSLLISLTMLMGNTTCPLDDQPAEEPTAGASSSLDVGGPAGALWRVKADRTLMVTLRTADGRVASAQVEAAKGQVSLAGRTIDTSSFCWRMDTICPHQVLPDSTAMQQPHGDSRLFTSYTARGPLGKLTDRTAIPGQVTGNDLVIPLAVGAAATTPNCALSAGSGVLASAYTEANSDEKRAVSMQGRVTVGFDGLCVALGGNGPLLPGDYLELSVSFTATRQ